MDLALARSDVDFGITYGMRTPDEQFELYKIGRREREDGEWEKSGSTVTNCDGFKKKSKHNGSPSLAVDIYAYHPDKETRYKIAYDKATLSRISGFVGSVAKELYNERKTKHLVTWGGNFDRDGVILYDQKLQDLCHFELYVPED